MKLYSYSKIIRLPTFPKLIYTIETGRANIFPNFSKRFLIYEDESLEGDGLIGRGGGKLAFS